MKHRLTRTWHLLTVLLLVLLPLLAAPALAAQPGEELINTSGTVSSTVPQQFSYSYISGPVNIRIHIEGGAPGDSVTVTLLDNTNAPVKSWNVQSGETAWGVASLAASGKFMLQTASASSLTYALTAYARGVAPTVTEGTSTWSGTASGSNSLQSALEVDVPTAGLYTFTFGSTSGKYQFKVDNDYIRKTVVAGALPQASDTVYYLSAATHSFTIIQDPATPTSDWSVTLAPVGGIDTLTSTESSAVLGGGSFFRDEWVPLQIGAAQAVNIKIQVDGGATTDNLMVELYNDGAKVFASTDIFGGSPGGEINWGSSTLTPGANALHIVAAAGNASPLAYTVTISAIESAPYTWAGVTYSATNRPNQGQSSIKLNFPADGLYSISLTAGTGGRFQFLLDESYLRKTASDGTAMLFTAFVTQGTHTLLIVQDPAKARTDWSVAIEASSATSDSLPYSSNGGTLGGAGNAFSEEWIPLQVTAGADVNFRITASGAPTASLKVELYNGDALVYSANTVYGSEVFWGTSALTAGNNRLHIVAAPDGPLTYDILMLGVAAIPGTADTAYAVEGASLGAGGNAGRSSVFRLNAPVSGIYDVIVTVNAGAGEVVIDPAASTVSLAGSTTTLRVPLQKGLHTFLFKQESTLASTTWKIETKLRRAEGNDGGDGGDGGGTDFGVFLPLIMR